MRRYEVYAFASHDHTELPGFRLVMLDDNGGIWHRCGRFATRAEAEAEAQRLRDRDALIAQGFEAARPKADAP